MAGIVFYIPKDVATAPAEGHCFVNRWWVVHPEKGVAFYAAARRPFLEAGDIDEPSPQCNQDEHIIRFQIKRAYPGCAAELIPAVFVGPAIREMHRVRKEKRDAETLTKTSS